MLACIRGNKGVYLQHWLSETELGKEMAEHGKNLGVNLWIRKAGDLGPDLMKLPVTTFLRPLVAKHGAHVIEFGNWIGGIEFVFNEGSHDAGSTLRTQGDLFCPLSTKEYISFSTISVASPMERQNSSVFSRIGTLISEKPYSSKILLAVFSMCCHFSTSWKYIVKTFNTSNTHAC